MEDLEIAVGIDVLRPGAKYKSCRSFQELFDTWDTEGNGEPCPDEAAVRAAGQAELAAQATAEANLETAISNDSTERTALNTIVAGRALAQQILTLAPNQIDTTWAGLTAGQKQQVAEECIFLIRVLFNRVRKLERLADKIKYTE